MSNLKISFLVVIVVLIPKIQFAQNCASFTYSQNANGVFFNSTQTCSGNVLHDWDFGDGTSSASINPYHIYSNTGIFPVQLYIRDSFNNLISNRADTVVVTSINPSLCANFSYTQNANVVNFTSLQSCPGTVFHNWDFGDGNTSSSINPSHTYSGNGLYAVYLTMKDGSNNTIDSWNDTVIVTSTNPSTCASFSQTVNFTSAIFSNTSSCPGAFYYNWDFGDGTFSAGANTSHLYNTVGNYNVRLIVSDASSNLLDNVTNTVQIQNAPPSCHALFAKSQTLDSSNNPISGLITIANLSTGTNLSYLWDFGDGTTSTLLNPQHQYTGNGPYLMCLSITDGTCSDSYCDTLSVDTNGNLKSKGFTISVVGGNGTINSIEQHEDVGTRISPNPFDQELTIVFSEDFTGRVVLYDILGKVKLTQQVSILAQKPHELNEVDNLEPGTYFLRFISSEMTFSKMILKQ